MRKSIENRGLSCIAELHSVVIRRLANRGMIGSSQSGKR